MKDTTPTIRLTAGEAIVRYLDNQYVAIEHGGEIVESKFVEYFYAVFGHCIGVNGMAEEDAVDEVGEGGDDHQRYDEGVAVGNLGNQEDARQWGVEHACNQTTHAYQGELGRVEFAQANIFHAEGEQQSRESSDEQGGSESAAHATGTEGQRGGKGF